MIHYITREDFVNHTIGDYAFHNEKINGQTVYTESLRSANVKIGKFSLRIQSGYDCWIYLTYKSCKTNDKKIKEATASLPVNRLNKTFIAAGCNIRILP
jgi:hypothetical protein